MTEIQDDAVKAVNNLTPPIRSSVPTSPVLQDKHYTEAAKFGRIDDSGNVFVKDGDSERQISNFPGEIPAEPLQIFIRRYLDLRAQIDLFAARLEKLTGGEIHSTLKSLSEQVKEPAVIGDLDALRKQVENLHTVAAQRIEEFQKQREAAREQAVKDRTAVVEEAEAVANQNVEMIQWKLSGQRIHHLLDEWKRLQHHGPRIDREVENALWKRFSAARTLFEKTRKKYFAELEAKRSEAKKIKERIIVEAEKLSDSTDWTGTARLFRDLMLEWKSAGRAGRKDDDALWERFNIAQQTFFDARNARSQKIDEEMIENLRLKKELLEKAEAILPVKDIEAAKSALRPIQEAWDQIGFIPKDEVSKTESRMRAVENAIRDAEEAEWQRTNPEKQARAAGMAGQLQALIDQIKVEIAEAEAAGDKKQVKELNEALKAREAWLAQVNAF